MMMRKIVFLKNIMLGKSEKKLYSLFSDCPSLVKLIDNDIATKGKLDIIIEYYNLYCK